MQTDRNETYPIKSFCPICVERIKGKQEEIHRWLQHHEGNIKLPLYSSVDIRDSGFKIAVVDTNLFPAGFNNICEHGLADAVGLMRNAIQKRVANCRNILIISEEHTRNTWYLENIRILQQIIENAGYTTKIATFLTDEPSFCQEGKYAELKTATEQTVKIFCFKTILEAIAAHQEHFDLIIMNNDLTTGIPEVLKNSTIPIYPSIQAGWHSRLKSHHFKHTEQLIKEFAQIVNMDPWFFSCIYAVEENIDVHQEADRQRLYQTAKTLFEDIREKYRTHGITGKPYIVVKADAGTYGMGVMPIENPDEIIDLNRKDRNKLHVGKSSQVISRYLLQEGVPTIYNIDNEVSEACIYQIENNLVGGFYRSHAQKGDRDNLNSKGMEFKKMCPHLKKYGECGIHHDVNIFDVYRLLARIAAIAAHREIIQLEANPK